MPRKSQLPQGLPVPWTRAHEVIVVVRESILHEGCVRSQTAVHEQIRDIF